MPISRRTPRVVVIPAARVRASSIARRLRASPQVRGFQSNPLRRDFRNHDSAPKIRDVRFGLFRYSTDSANGIIEVTFSFFVFSQI